MDSNLPYIINHVFLPPKLPQKDDSSPSRDAALAETLLEGLKAFHDLLPTQQQPQWSPLIRMIYQVLSMRDSQGGMATECVGDALEAMIDGDVLAFHIRSQNAGLLVRKYADHYVFEASELSPTNEAITSTKGRLRRCFPGPAIAVANERLEDVELRSVLAAMLTKLDAEPPKDAQPVVHKARSVVSETRDTCHPMFVTEMLSGMLRAIGKEINVHRFYKHTRDEVLWKDTLNPWRRSPLWLLLRVAMQTSLEATTSSADSRARYKSFMLFFMGQTLQHARKASLPSHLLFAMAAKIARRALKLGVKDKPAWFESLQKEAEAVRHDLIVRRNHLAEDPHAPGPHVASIASRSSLRSELNLSLYTLRSYLSGIATRAAPPISFSLYDPKCRRRLLQCFSTPPHKPPISEQDQDDLRLYLADVELWVQDFLSDWVSINLGHKNACETLASIISTYTQTAASLYKDAPEDQSLKILTAMDLWVALDRCAVHAHPLLRQYRPGFPLDACESLLLPKKCQMERLFSIERYLAERTNNASAGSELAFQSVGEPESLAVRFFEQSQRHKSLRQKIEEQAEIDRARKQTEFDEKTLKYRDLMRQSNEQPCICPITWVRKQPVRNYSSLCLKCSSKKSAEAIEIKVHEWPLPRLDLKAKTVVFELDVPAVISQWRDTTYRILTDVLSPQATAYPHHCGKTYQLLEYSGLGQFVGHQAGRIQLASKAKPFTVAHYKSRFVKQASISDVCVNHGMSYEMYDSELDCWTAGLLDQVDVRQQCTFQVPPGPYADLQDTVTDTRHTSNEVIARQGLCSHDLTMHEFYAFGTLRSGHRLQWRNITRELCAGILDLGRSEVHALFMAAAWQACPLGGLGGLNACREAHADLEEEDFCLSMLVALDEAVTAVQSNWQGAPAVRLLATLAARLLSLTSWANVRERCLLFLRRVRTISLCWTRELDQKLGEGQGDDAGSLRTLEMALTCHGTFDVDVQHVTNLICSDEDVAAVIECSIAVRRRCPAETQGLPDTIKPLLRRYWRLSHHLESHLRQKILECPQGLDLTVGRLWDGFTSHHPWQACKSPNERWLTTTRSNGEGHSTDSVHYNLLEGRLLVNGSPLTRLPPKYESHPTFRRAFGQRIIHVVPSTMERMTFESRSAIRGQKFFFAMHDSELIVRAQEQNRVHELLPPCALQKEFPQAFVLDYVHWFDISTGDVEWRPLTEPLTSSSKNWRMCKIGQTEHLKRGLLSLIDVRSATAKDISAILRPLEHANHMHITLEDSSETLSVHLPRLNLDFFMKPGTGRLESKQFRGMMVDSDQAFGTMTGLVSKLVLRSANGSSRGVIIPFGEVDFEQHKDHVRVRVASPAKSYHYYRIDHQLSRLADAGSLISQLFKAYLHALTAHCLPDELTGRTGTEEALSVLASASVRSFFRLEPAEIELLVLLSRLTPHREYYPAHLRVMHTVSWNSLSPLSQHESFATLVQSIFQHARTLDLIVGTPAALPGIDLRGAPDLLERAMTRNSALRVDGFGAEAHTANHDVPHSSRDHTASKKEADVFRIARLVDNWSHSLSVTPHLLAEIESWGSPLEVSQNSQDHPLEYSLKWLESPQECLRQEWCSLQSALSGSGRQRDKYKIMALLSTLAFNQHAKQDLVQTILAFATVPGLRAIRPPDFEAFWLSDGYQPTRGKLLVAVQACAKPFEVSPEAVLPALHWETVEQTDRRRYTEYQWAVEVQLRLFADTLVSQGPTASITPPTGTSFDAYLLVDQAMRSVQSCFASWHRNDHFRKYIHRSQGVLDTLVAGHSSVSEYRFSLPVYTAPAMRTHVRAKELFDVPAPQLPPTPCRGMGRWVQQHGEAAPNPGKLGSFLSRFRSESQGAWQAKYAYDLTESFESRPPKHMLKMRGSPEALASFLETSLADYKKFADNVYQTLCHALEAEASGAGNLAFTLMMWPRLSRMCLLQWLANGVSSSLDDSWKVTLTRFGLAISDQQFMERAYSLRDNEPELLSELSNLGHQDWRPLDHPEWLLLEIENNLLIRPAQVRVALEMISPSSGRNSLLQLNMGEGKSSVILPMVATALANRKKLVRVVVLQALANQMSQLLCRRLGGLLGRPIFHLPVSRSLDLDASGARQIQRLCVECMDSGGLLLVQPEHLLSFELMGIERTLAGEKTLGRTLIDTQHWLENQSRDILDESDEILSVKFELVYTIGAQRGVEFSPDRWAITQRILALVRDLVPAVFQEFPEAVELEPVSRGCFPHLRILNSTAANQLLMEVSRRVCDGSILGFPTWNLPEPSREAFFSFLMASSLDSVQTAMLQDDVLTDPLFRSGALLLRGLLAPDGVLPFALQQKRYRVDYGLDPIRSQLAVPYRAKDSPAARAEFSHPDSTILLTCLSYYYEGLTEKQLHKAFERVLGNDNAQEEYESWIRDVSEIRSVCPGLTSVNLSDSAQFSSTIFPLLRRAKGVIDFFLSNDVFPKEMREFPQKLSGSGWNIARTKKHSTTGFSGTNDSRYVLPLSVDQVDLPHQRYTNAAQLECLLQPENKYQTTRQKAADILGAESILHIILEAEPAVRVILDVGAQVLEWENDQMARKWLERTPEHVAQAVVFFNEHNDLAVYSRDGATDRLLVSPFAEQLDQCLVYLDEAHTRGTDLKLPRNYRAAVTLGPNLTKDRLVQACMRMRKLGKGQSVMFCAPMEVERAIIKCTSKTEGDMIEVEDVLKWSMLCTCTNIQRSVPLWATQGLRYQRHAVARSEPACDESGGFTSRAASLLLEDDAQSLASRYGPGTRTADEKILLEHNADASLAPRQAEVDAIRARCQEFQLVAFTGATLQEEQERELSPESEKERQVERPPAQRPCQHSVHPHVKILIQQGIFHQSAAFQSAFETLRQTSAAGLNLEQWPPQLLVTADFARTVQSTPNSHLDDFLRPVHWIARIQSAGAAQLVILSPFEANELLPSFRASKVATLHVYSPRTSMSMRSLEDLSFCAVSYRPQPRPSDDLVRQLNLFAGQLYLRSYDEYLSVCRFLGLSFRPRRDGVDVARDGFVTQASSTMGGPEVAAECSFSSSPVALLRALVVMRRKGQSFALSHVGRLLQGQPLSAVDFGQGDHIVPG